MRVTLGFLCDTQSLPPATGTENQKFSSFGWFFFQKNKQCLKCKVGITGSNWTIIKETFNVVHQYTAQLRAVCIIKYLNTKQVRTKTFAGLVSLKNVHYL